jgi:hypothetical protein
MHFGNEFYFYSKCIYDQWIFFDVEGWKNLIKLILQLKSRKSRKHIFVKLCDEILHQNRNWVKIRICVFIHTTSASVELQNHTAPGCERNGFSFKDDCLDTMNNLIFMVQFWRNKYTNLTEMCRCRASSWWSWRGEKSCLAGFSYKKNNFNIVQQRNLLEHR